VISVVLGEPSEAARDAESLALLRHGVDSFRRAVAVSRRATLARPALRYGDDAENVPLRAARTVRLTVRRGEPVSRRVRAPRELEGPLARGQRVGAVDLLYRNRVVRTVPLVVAVAVPEPSSLDRLAASSAEAGLTLIGLLVIVLGGAAAVRARSRRARRTRRAAGARS